MTRRRLGQVLLERGAISAAQLEEALQTQRRTHQRLGALLVEAGFTTEEALVQALADSVGVPAVNLEAVRPDWTAVHALRRDFCEQHAVFPFALEGPLGQRQLVVAFADPLHAGAAAEIETRTGLRVRPCVATFTQVREAIRHYYRANASEPEMHAPLHVRQKASSPELPAPASAPTGNAGPSPWLVVADDEDVIEGEVVEDDATDAPERAAPKSSTPIPVTPSVDQNLHYLLPTLAARQGTGTATDDGPLQSLVALLLRKGVFTADEWAEALSAAERNRTS